MTALPSHENAENSRDCTITAAISPWVTDEPGCATPQAAEALRVTAARARSIAGRGAHAARGPSFALRAAASAATRAFVYRSRAAACPLGDVSPSAARGRPRATMPDDPAPRRVRGDRST